MPFRALIFLISLSFLPFSSAARADVINHEFVGPYVYVSSNVILLNKFAHNINLPVYFSLRSLQFYVKEGFNYLTVPLDNTPLRGFNGRMLRRELVRGLFISFRLGLESGYRIHSVCYCSIHFSSEPFPNNHNGRLHMIPE